MNSRVVEGLHGLYAHKGLSANQSVEPTQPTTE